MDDEIKPSQDGYEEVDTVCHGAASLAGLVAPATLLSLAACGGSEAPALPAAFDRPDQAQRSTLLAAATEGPLAAATPSADALMDWAQQVYPDFFPGSPATASFAPYLYRYYERSANYVGVADGRVYVLGPVSGGQLLDVGALADFAPLVATDYRVAKPASDEEAARFLLQAQFSARRADIASVRSLGYAGWLEQHFNAPAGIMAWNWLDSRGYTVIDQYGYFGNGYQMFFALWHQLITSPDAARKRMAAALSEFFVASLYGVSSAWQSWVICDYWDMLSAHALGNFRTLLGKVSMHSAIGQQLTIVGSQNADPFTGQQPDENFARELMQLFSIGLYELNIDGTEKLDSQGRRIETYTQNDVSNLAPVFTGYDLAPLPRKTFVQSGTPFTNFPDISQARLPMVCNANLHSTDDVRFLGAFIAGSTPPQQKLDMALDVVFRHPNVGPFFGRQMIQRLVTSNPSPGYVARVAAAFNDNGTGVRGDLRAVFTAVLLDPEARGPGGLGSTSFGKLREPMIRITQLARSFGMTSKAGSWKMIGLPQQLLNSPTVFNYFRPGYRLPPALAAGQNLKAPEFQIVDEVTVAEWVNLVRDITGNGGIFVPAPDIPAFYVNQFDLTILHTAAAGRDLSYSFDEELPLVFEATALVQHLNLVLAAGQLSAPTCALIAEGLRANFGNSPPPQISMEIKLQLLSWAITMVMSAPEYLIQK